MHVADGDEIAADQRTHFGRFVEQELATVLGRVFLQNELGDLLRMLHCVGPTLETRFTEGLDPCWIFAQFSGGGEQVVTVEVDADRARRKDEMCNLRLVDVIRFRRAVTAHGVDHAIDEVVVVEGVGNDLKG